MPRQKETQFVVERQITAVFKVSVKVKAANRLDAMEKSKRQAIYQLELGTEPESLKNVFVKITP